jgi:hypothetical protein
MTEKFTLIGIDGGATKVSGWSIRFMGGGYSFRLSRHQAELNYSSLPGFIDDFKPVALPDQLQQKESNRIELSQQEIIQGPVFTKACAQVIIALAKKSKQKPVLVGIGMPGLKTEDRRGITAMANGPRIPDYAAQVETRVRKAGVDLFTPIRHLGSDADYCGMGEAYARGGLFHDVNNAYYLGGGTGTADALMLHKELVPFDKVKNWLAKTWEMKNDLGLSMEKYASTSGIQFMYSRLAGIPVEELNREKIFPLQIALRVLKGDTAAVLTYKQIVKYLSLLLLERITTLHSGWQSLLEFVTPARDRPCLDHPYRNEVFHRIVIGQRLGEFQKTPVGKKVLLDPLRRELAGLISNSACLPLQAKKHYLSGERLPAGIIVLSALREAPALGAGIDALLNCENYKHKRG